MARVVLLADGMSELGTAICTRLALLGYRIVAVHAPDNAGIHDWLAAMRSAGHAVHAHPCEADDIAAVRSCVVAMENEIGPLEIFVNNAGIVPGRDSYRSPLLEAVCAGMLARGWGRIINIPVHDETGVRASSDEAARTRDLTGELALQFAGHAITVNAILPAYRAPASVMPQQKEDARSAPARHWEQEQEAAALLAYFASDEAAFLSGACIAINGDRHLS